MWICQKCTFEDLSKAFGLSVRCRVIRCWSNMPDSVLIAEFTEFSSSEWSSIVRYDLLRVAKHGENISKFSDSVESACVWNRFGTPVFTNRVDIDQPHRTIKGPCIVDVNSLPWTWRKSYAASGDLAGSFLCCAQETHWEQRRSIFASIPGHHTRERARPFIRTTPMWVSWRRLSIVNLSVWGTTTLKLQSRIFSTMVSFSLRR